MGTDNALRPAIRTRWIVYACHQSERHAVPTLTAWNWPELSVELTAGAPWKSKDCMAASWSNFSGKVLSWMTLMTNICNGMTWLPLSGKLNTG